MTHADMNDLLTQVSKALCYGKVRNNSLFVSVAVSYPNGVGVSVRIDPRPQGKYIVSDDGYASVIADTMRAGSNLRRVANGVAARSGVNYERGTFFVEDVESATLPSVVSAVANASASAMERVVAALEQPRLRRQRELFDKRLTEAFGRKVHFNVPIKGSTGRDYDFSAGIEQSGSIVRLFELVFPSTQAVALANMKISDTLALSEAPSVTVALADYNKTDPTLRSILSAAGGLVIAANDDISAYQLVS